MGEEKRKFPRVPTTNAVSYICLDADENPIEEGMGVTVNISLGGALLETSREIRGAYLLLVSIDVKKNVLQTKAKVIHCRSVGPSKFQTGIEFMGPIEERTRLIKSLITDYHKRKTKPR